MLTTLKGLGAFLGLFAKALNAAWKAYQVKHEQSEADRIRDNPAGEWMRRFKRKAVNSKPVDPSGPSEHDSE